MALIDVIKYNGSPDVFAWKYPSEELGTWTQLIVNESQEAVLFKGGKALDLFTGGRHTLETANIPILNNIINLPFGGRSPFAAEVWFVNKVYSLDIKWGTATPIQLQDPKYKVFVPLRSFGQFGIQIEDSRKFLIKLVGTLPSFDKESLVKYFRGLYLTKVKDTISSYLVHKQISVLDINASLDEISELLKEKMVPILSDYGIKLINFYVNDINVPEDDSAVIKLKAALAKRAEMDIVGYSYAQERSFNTLEGAATNPSTGQAGFMGAGLGLGMGVGMGGVFGQQMGNLANNITTSVKRNCPKCSAMIDQEVRFCNMCGYDTQKQTIENKEATEKERASVNCSCCKAAYLVNVKFCPECGDKYNPCPKCKADMNEMLDICLECCTKLQKPCPDCGYKIDNMDAKFCPECGKSFIRKCPKCSVEMKASEKFCSECGEKL
jgi:membrane protease subunit (stomatin/prohibitin family)